jgi:hypothetical protein
VPGELYSYADNNQSKVVAKVNGKRVRTNVVDGYMPVQRAWQAGDKVELELPMPVRYSVADERVEADVNRVCITRGPLVYCAEQPDNEFVASTYVVNNIGDQGKVATFSEGIMSGINNITLKSESVDILEGTTTPATLKLIPYYAWNNRGDNMTMNVWFARDAETVVKSMIRTVGNVMNVEASYTFSNDDPIAVADGKHPKSSADGSIPRWTSWSEHQLGKSQTLEVTLRKEQKIESVSIYWFDDRDGVYLPKEWSMEYKDGEEWKPFQPYVTDRFGVAPDQFNMVHPHGEVTTRVLRINMTPQPNKAVGVLELVIE